MYFLLRYPIFFTSNIVPNMLILVGGGTMSVNGCITQFYLLGVPAIAQCLLLAAVSFDRYVTKCKSLHYNTILTQTL
ncbi:hypothetical protein XELAEV_18019353mg [Xenopus laevis]|uniref:G-protein coupled receptors family 1 profile domain-containing protein n=1 Tax=Xenopus laevis TaxID=8355 RepID=A0A974HUR2_XENLA|nr:hypothetical protein XELAEV_18019353mg [Xenopus laevis]